MKIHAKAPTRIDLAGGTLDLWPLYLFLERPTTVNLGIDLFAEAWLEDLPSPSKKSTVTLRAEDQDRELKLDWKDIATASAPPQLELHLKLLRFIAGKHDAQPRGELILRTRAGSPAGAGLGGSSTLSVALVGAITAWARGGEPGSPAASGVWQPGGNPGSSSASGVWQPGENPGSSSASGVWQPGGSPALPCASYNEGEALVDVVRDIETTVIQVPAGVQDYYGAMFGGLQSLRWGAGRHEREWLPESLLPGLESRIALFYSGQSRNSGINNWALFKAFIDKQGDVRERFARINQAARDLEKALRAQDWEAAGRAIEAEWETRRTLAPGISTPEMDRAFENALKVAPSRAGKVCGAGGGGCFFVYVPDPRDKPRIEAELAASGLRVLPFHASPKGLDVQTET